MSADQAANDGDMNQPSAVDTTIPLPEQKPTQAADLDPLIIAQRNIQPRAHIPVQGGDDPEPLCVHGIDSTKEITWIFKAQAVYPDPNAWFILCTKCLQAYEQVTTGGAGKA